MQKFIATALIASAVAVDTNIDDEITQICKFAKEDVECDNAPIFCVQDSADNKIAVKFANATGSDVAASASKCKTGVKEIAVTGTRGEDDEKVFFNVATTNHVFAADVATNCLPIALAENKTGVAYLSTAAADASSPIFATAADCAATSGSTRNRAYWTTVLDTTNNSAAGVKVVYERYASGVAATKTEMNFSATIPACGSISAYPGNTPASGDVATIANFTPGKPQVCHVTPTGSAAQYYKVNTGRTTATGVTVASGEFVILAEDKVTSGCYLAPQSTDATKTGRPNNVYFNIGVQTLDSASPITSAAQETAFADEACKVPYVTITPATASTPVSLSVVSLTTLKSALTVANGAANNYLENTSTTGTHYGTVPEPLYVEAIKCADAANDALPAGTTACFTGPQTADKAKPKFGQYTQAICESGSVVHDECTVAGFPWYVSLGEDQNNAVATGAVAAVAAAIVASRF